MNEPPDHTAELSAANLLSADGITVPKYSLNSASCSLSPWSQERNSTPSCSSFPLRLWYAPSAAALEHGLLGVVEAELLGVALAQVEVGGGAHDSSTSCPSRTQS